MKSITAHKWDRTPDLKMERSKFDRSHGIKTTFDAGLIIPVYVDEVLPGDTFNLNMNFFARLNTPLKPVMDNMILESFFFFVPYRLLWTNFKKMMGEQVDPGDTIAYTVPTMPSAAAGPEVGTLADYMGLPTDIAATYSWNTLPFRAYNLIWNEWFRDQNLQDSIVVDTDNGPDTYANYVLKRRGKRHDYLTSCLPWPQKGATAQSLPLGTSAPVTRVSSAVAWKMYDAGGDVLAAAHSPMETNASSEILWSAGATGSLDPLGGLIADLSTATAATINQLRQAEMYQLFLERDARGGTRYIEIIKNHFGVTSDDARHQRPEFLGGGSAAVNIHPVPQTSTAAGANPEDQQGHLAGFGTVSGGNHGFRKSFTEHGLILGLVSVRADLTYQQGVDRMWSRSTRFDFFWPLLSSLGEQSVLNKEIYVQGTAADDLVFGYQGRYDEYRYKSSRITGALRSTYATTLDSWHLSEKFTALPVLNDAFIQDDPPIDRVVAVNTEPDFLLDAYISLQCARPIPVYGIPSLGARL